MHYAGVILALDRRFTPALLAYFKDPANPKVIQVIQLLEAGEWINLFQSPLPWRVVILIDQPGFPGIPSISQIKPGKMVITIEAQQIKDQPVKVA